MQGIEQVGHASSSAPEQARMFGANAGMMRDALLSGSLFLTTTYDGLLMLSGSGPSRFGHALYVLITDPRAP
jgi:hypothetical protein